MNEKDTEIMKKLEAEIKAQGCEMQSIAIETSMDWSGRITAITVKYFSEP